MTMGISLFVIVFNQNTGLLDAGQATIQLASITLPAFIVYVILKIKEEDESDDTIRNKSRNARMH